MVMESLPKPQYVHDNASSGEGRMAGHRAGRRLQLQDGTLLVILDEGHWPTPEGRLPVARLAGWPRASTWQTLATDRLATVLARHLALHEGETRPVSAQTLREVESVVASYEALRDADSAFKALLHVAQDTRA
jgi:hypothetical protein